MYDVLPLRTVSEDYALRAVRNRTFLVNARLERMFGDLSAPPSTLHGMRLAR